MKEGPQPPRCILQACDNVPANGLVGYCAGHEKLLGDGSNVTAPLVEPDDPALLERLAKKAAAQEEQEYAERRRVKTWKTLENGTRTPEEYWSDDELKAIDEEAKQAVLHLGQANIERTLPRDYLGVPYVPAPEDPVKEAAKLFKRALRGKLGEVARAHAWSFAAMLEER